MHADPVTFSLQDLRLSAFANSKPAKKKRRIRPLFPQEDQQNNDEEETTEFIIPTSRLAILVDWNVDALLMVVDPCKDADPLPPILANNIICFDASHFWTGCITLSNLVQPNALPSLYAILSTAAKDLITFTQTSKDLAFVRVSSKQSLDNQLQIEQDEKLYFVDRGIMLTNSLDVNNQIGKVFVAAFKQQNSHQVLSVVIPEPDSSPQNLIRSQFVALTKIQNKATEVTQDALKSDRAILKAVMITTHSVSDIYLQKEQKLLTSFMAILNEKKRRIAELESQQQNHS